MYKGSPNDFSCDKADWVPYLLYSYVIEYGGLFGCFIRYIAGIYVLRQRRQLVIEFILAQCLLLKGTQSKSNQLLSALIYSWNSFAFPAGLGHGYASLAIKHLPPFAWLICHTEHAPSECGRRSRLCNLLRFFFFAFISTPSLWLIPDTVLIPPLTREKEREREREREVLVLELLGNSCLPECNWSQLATATWGTQAAAPHRRRLLVTLPRAARWTQ